MGEKLNQLKERLATVTNLRTAAAVLEWDMQTQMPPGGAAARANQLGTLAHITHAMFTSDEIGALLEAAEREIQGEPADSDDVCLIRVARHDYDLERRVPSALRAEIQRHATLAHEQWTRARAENNFDLFAPYLERTIALSRQVAEHLGYQEHLYDALLDQFEPGMTTNEVHRIFRDLKKDLVPLVQAIRQRADRVSDEVLHRPYDEGKQEMMGKTIATAYGYDWSRGRQDRAVHPFMINFSRDDVRITTRFDSNFLNPALFGTLHETGHALYEQGLAPELDGNVLAGGASLGLHESQSRLWENVVGRSHGLWEHFYPQLQQTFPGALGDVDLDTFYGAINRVEPSLIRVEADEVTYNLHIMVRFEMELDLLEGRCSVHDAPAIWDQKIEDYLGIRPPTNSEGILQDVHWAGGMMGYFPTYTLGNILSAQLYEAALRDHPEIPGHIREGRFDTLRGWLTEHIYRHGRKFEPADLVQRATGEPMQTRSYLDYLRTKYGAIYGVELAPAG